MKVSRPPGQAGVGRLLPRGLLGAPQQHVPLVTLSLLLPLLPLLNSPTCLSCLCEGPPGTRVAGGGGGHQACPPPSPRPECASALVVNLPEWSHGEEWGVGALVYLFRLTGRCGVSC